MSSFVASYERKFSDGNFGSEGLSLSWSWEDDDGDDEEAIGSMFETTVHFLRTLVLTELSKSASERVRFVANHALRARAGETVVGVATAHIEPDLEDLPF